MSALEVNITVLIIVLIVFIAITVVLLRRTKNGNTTKSRTKEIAKTTKSPRRRDNPYQAKSIIFNDTACDAVKAVGNKRFLDSERRIPKLPLSDCNKQQCDCRYERHKDRRAFNEDRRNPSPLHSDLHESVGETNRRQKKRGRRKDDWA